MLGPVDYALWFVTFLTEIGALVCLLKARAVARYFPVALYLSAVVATEIGRYSILRTAGYASNTYLYFYFYSDSLLTIALYFVLMGLYSQVFSDLGISKYLRGGAMLLLAGTAGISYAMVAESSEKLVTHFVIEFSRNLYFVGVLLTYLLWGAMMKMREGRTRLVQLVLILGVYFSAFAGSYALGNLYPDLVLWRYVPHLMALWLPASWAYTFARVPENARMSTASLAASEHR